jgi:hypothetical protein
MDPRVRQAATNRPTEWLSDNQWAPVLARLSNLRRMRHPPAPQLVQPSLFDRRAVREAAQRDAVRVQWDTWQARLEARLETAPVRSVARVLAVLPVDGWAP